MLGFNSFNFYVKTSHLSETEQAQHFEALHELYTEDMKDLTLRLKGFYSKMAQVKNSRKFLFRTE